MDVDEGVKQTVPKTAKTSGVHLINGVGCMVCGGRCGGTTKVRLGGQAIQMSNVWGCNEHKSLV